MLKRLIRSAMRRTQKWLAAESDERRAKQNHDEDLFLYPWLNTLLSKIVAEEGGAQRPAYAWGVLQGANLARVLEVERISVIEFGVAGGHGLHALEKIAKTTEGILNIKIDVYGFDTGSGLPKPQDYRDLPNLWAAGYFPMEHEKLQEHLTRAQLVLGLVEDTIINFIHSKPAPVAFISFDLDFYSSTMQSFKLLEADPDILLPRIHCYFDDIMGFTYGDHNGERLAISDFNSAHKMRKISQIYGLKYYVPNRYSRSMWVEKCYMAHILDHNLYGCNDGLVTKAGAKRATM